MWYAFSCDRKFPGAESVVTDFNASGLVNTSRPHICDTELPIGNSPSASNERHTKLSRIL